MSLKNKGFTLIELLVVIAIIGLLASVVLVVLSTARAKARDAKRRTDLKQLATALALYYDTNSGYPVTGAGVWFGACPAYGGYGTSGAGGWVPNLAPAFVGVLPTDPKPVDTDGCYLYQSDGVDFKLLAYKTVEGSVPASDPMYDPARASNYVFAIYTAGATNW